MTAVEVGEGRRELCEVKLLELAEGRPIEDDEDSASSQELF